MVYVDIQAFYYCSDSLGNFSPILLGSGIGIGIPVLLFVIPAMKINLLLQFKIISHFQRRVFTEKRAKPASSRRNSLANIEIL